MSASGPRSYPVVFDTDLGLQYSFESGYIQIPAPHVTPPAGADTQIQFNNMGAFGASPALTWDALGNQLVIASSTTGSGITLGSNSGDFINFADSTVTNVISSINGNPDGSITIETDQQGADNTWSFGADGGLQFPPLATEPGSPVEGEVIYNSTTHQMETYNGTAWIGAAPTPSVVDSSATVGGAAVEEVTVAGLLTTSTIWAVTQRTKGGANLPLLSWTNVIDGHLNVIYSADMGPGAVVRVLFIP